MTKDEREEILRQIRDSKVDKPSYGTWEKAHDCCISIIENIDITNESFVKHGKWLGHCGSGQYDDFYCSLCHWYEGGTRNRKFLGKYCSHCGAKMEFDIDEK